MKVTRLFLLAIVLKSFGADSAPCNDLLDSGDASYAVFDNLKALDYYAKAYKECPNIFDPLMKMTRAVIDVGEDFNDTGSGNLYRAAMKFTDTLQFSYPDSAQSYFLRSVAAANLFDFTQGKQKIALARIVLTNAEKSIDLAPSFAPAYVVLGSYYRRVATAGTVQKMLARIIYGTVPHGTLKDSKNTLLKALRLSPENIYGCLELARTLVAMGEKKEAVDLLEKVPEMPVAWHLDKKLKQKAASLLVKLK
jgi:tetratricopeptide (TPR) repeat protein